MSTYQKLVDFVSKVLLPFFLLLQNSTHIENIKNVYSKFVIKAYYLIYDF